MLKNSNVLLLLFSCGNRRVKINGLTTEGKSSIKFLGVWIDETKMEGSYSYR